MTPPVSRFALVALLGLAASGCDGAASQLLRLGEELVGADAEPKNENDPDACQAGELSVPPARLRRVTPEQYLNTARDLLADPGASPKLESSRSEIITELEVERLNFAAEELVARKAHLKYLPCDASGTFDRSCAERFIDAFGKAAFRRPLEADEKGWLLGTFDAVRATPGVTPAITFQESIDAVAQVLLQSGPHVYLPELGQAQASLPPGIHALTGHERATRLSYLLWNSMPDAELTAAADSGALDSLQGVRAQAERLLASPRAHASVRRFASSWLGLDATVQHPALEMLSKSAERFPLDSPALRAAMRTEAEALYERAFFGPGGSFETLLTSREALVNQPLAQLYGVTGPATAAEFTWVDLPASQRAGLLTRAAFLTQQASDQYQSPIRRGVHLYRNVLCQTLGDPPADADDVPAAPGGSGASLMTVRSKTDVKTAGASCQSCHSVINPLGYTLEHYDAVGAWQTHDTGTTAEGQPFALPIDAKATVLATDFAGPVEGGVGLSAKLATSAMAHDCLAQKWFTQALDRAPTPADACVLGRVQAEFRKSHDMRELVLGLASSDSALFVRAP